MQIEMPIDLFTYPDVPLPEVWSVEQRYDTPALAVAEIEAQVRQAIETLVADPRLKPGANVAVGVGSRGVDNIVTVARTVVADLKARGLNPFLVPAMGSHGGATAEGQVSLLNDYGITAKAMGADIRATMEVDEIGHLADDGSGEFIGHPVYWDKIAHQADAVLLLNRIKAHTDFRGDLESGISKMSVIGLGKRHGAESIHRYGAYGLSRLIPRIARFLTAHVPLIGGIAMLENELGKTCEVHAVPAADMALEPERALLRRARQLAPRLPFADIDILVIDEMGKNISGTGMDTHVIGRALMPSFSDTEWGGPNVRLLIVCDLTAASHGNAAGLGLADLIPRRLLEKVDFEATFTNTRTSGEGGILKSRLPLTLPTGEDCVRTAIATCGRSHYEDVRLVRIRNTADTRFLEISGALLAEAQRSPALHVKEASHPLELCDSVQL